MRLVVADQVGDTLSAIARCARPTVIATVPPSHHLLLQTALSMQAAPSGSPSAGTSTAMQMALSVLSPLTVATVSTAFKRLSSHRGLEQVSGCTLTLQRSPSAD